MVGGNTIYYLDLIGTGVFAISGFLAAAERRMDIFGAATIALTTAVGGGTIRDLLIGSRPVGWLQDTHYLMAIGLGIFLALLFKNTILGWRRTLFLFDTIGIGLFTILGLEKTLAAGLTPAIAILMGTVSAVFGGVLRDIMANEVPLIFRQEIYATACLAGAILYVLLQHTSVPPEINLPATMLFIMVVRVLAVLRKWSLPVVTIF